ncbi:MAG TPA: hypothetical protein DCL41_03700 [Bdellovibrionales bacterium]|nr:hypothetical protein [Bdellovibrionales bacterium]
MNLADISRWRTLFMSQKSLKLIPLVLTLALSTSAYAGPLSWLGFGKKESETKEAPQAMETREVLELKLDPRVKDFIENLTEKALEGKIEPYVGGEHLMAQMDQIFEGKKGLSVMGIAPRGAGKSALINGYALHLAQKPGSKKVILALDVEAFLAGEAHAVQERSKNLIEFLKANPQAILMIDEVHKIFKDGATLPNALKPLMAEGKIQIGSFTTDYEYKEFVEKDAAWKDRHTSINLPAPTHESVVRVLQDKLKSYTDFYQVKVLQSAIEEIAKQVPLNFAADSYNRKALEILDQVMSSEAREMKEGDVQSKILEGRISSLKKSIQLHQEELDFTSDPEETKEKIEELKKELTSLLTEHEEIQSKEKAKKLSEQLPELYKKLRNLSENQVEEKRKLEFEIAEIKHEIELANLKEAPRGIIDRIKVLKLVGQMVGIPLDILAESPKRHLERRESTLKSILVGQDSAIDRALEFVRLSSADLGPRRGPKALTLLVGGPGLGKDTYAELTSELREGKGRSPITVNFAQMDAGTFKNAFFGIAGGYVDSEQGGMLDEVRQRPNATIHLAEIDKLGPRELNSLLTLLDSGISKDGRGRPLDLRNSEVVLSANWGAEYSYDKLAMSDSQIETKYGLDQGSLNGKSPEAKDKMVITKIMRDAGVSVEFIDRIKDQIVVMNSLSFDQTVEVARRLVNRQIESVRDHRRVEIKVDPSVYYMVARNGYSPGGGARSIGSSASSTIKNILADVSVNHEEYFEKGSTLEIKFDLKADESGGTLRVHSKGKEVASREIELGKFDVYQAERLSTPPKGLKSIPGEVGRVSDPRNAKVAARKAVRRAKKR